jgi:hypothetical protein
MGAVRAAAVRATGIEDGEEKGRAASGRARVEEGLIWRPFTRT